MGRNWAIIIGINHYTFLNDLKWAIRDAQLTVDFFGQKFKKDQNCKILHFSPQAKDSALKPTRSHIRHLLKDLKNKELKPEDNLYFFFSGHGWVGKDNQDYLMLEDSNPDDLEDTAISTKFIIEQLRESHAGNIFLFLDACRQTGKKNGLGIGTDTIKEAKAKKIITFFSCSSGEFSYEIDPIKQSSFTCALLEGLNGKGNCRNLGELESYVKNRVIELNHHYRKPKQTPQLVIETIAELSKSSVSFSILLEKNHPSNKGKLSNKIPNNTKKIGIFILLFLATIAGFYQENKKIKQDLVSLCLKPFNLPEDIDNKYCNNIPKTQPVKSSTYPFVCQRINGVPTTLVKSPDGTIREFIKWTSTLNGVSPDVRCQQTTSRMNSYIKEGTGVYVTHGIMNDSPVICVTDKKGSGCTGLLFDLGKDQDPQAILSDLLELNRRNFYGSPLIL